MAQQEIVSSKSCTSLAKIFIQASIKSILDDIHELALTQGKQTGNFVQLTNMIVHFMSRSTQLQQISNLHWPFGNDLENR